MQTEAVNYACSHLQNGLDPPILPNFDWRLSAFVNALWVRTRFQQKSRSIFEATHRTKVKRRGTSPTADVQLEKKTA